MSATPRVRTPWEAQIVSGSIAVVTVVVAVCLCIATIALLLFGLAQLRAHWP